MLNDRTIVKVKIAEIVKGGAVAYLEGIRGFIPASKLAGEYVEDLEEYNGKTIDVTVITADEENKKLVLSGKEPALMKQKEETGRKIAKCQVGSIMDFKTFVGAFSGMGEEDFKNIIMTQAEATVEQRLVVTAIAEKEGIVITDEDRKEVADQMGYESVEAMIETAGQFDVDDYIMNNKVMDFLTENAVIK